MSAASVSRWRALERDVRPGPLGGNRRSGRIEAQAGLILALLAAMPDITVEELRARSAPATTPSATARCSASSPGTGSRAKKDRARQRAGPPRCPEAAAAWLDAQPYLEPERLVFIDETWAKTNMARTHGRAPRG